MADIEINKSINIHKNAKLVDGHQNEKGGKLCGACYGF